MQNKLMSNSFIDDDLCEIIFMFEMSIKV